MKQCAGAVSSLQKSPKGLIRQQQATRPHKQANLPPQNGNKQAGRKAPYTTGPPHVNAIQRQLSAQAPREDSSDSSPESFLSDTSETNLNTCARKSGKEDTFNNLSFSKAKKLPANSKDNTVAVKRGHAHTWYNDTSDEEGIEAMSKNGLSYKTPIPVVSVTCYDSQSQSSKELSNTEKPERANSGVDSREKPVTVEDNQSLLSVPEEEDYDTAEDEMLETWEPFSLSQSREGVNYPKYEIQTENLSSEDESYDEEQVDSGKVMQRESQKGVTPKLGDVNWGCIEGPDRDEGPEELGKVDTDPESVLTPKVIVTSFDEEDEDGSVRSAIGDVGEQSEVKQSLNDSGYEGEVAIPANGVSKAQFVEQFECEGQSAQVQEKAEVISAKATSDVADAGQTTDQHQQHANGSAEIKDDDSLSRSSYQVGMLTLYCVEGSITKAGVYRILNFEINSLARNFSISIKFFGISSCIIAIRIVLDNS